MRGPMSRPIQPSGTSTPSQLAALRARVDALAEAEVDAAVAASRARTARARAPRAPAARPSSSHIDAPTSWPWTLKKGKHIAPPIRTVSASSRKRRITAILSVTLAPPSTATSGRAGSARIASSTVTSRSSSSPAAASATWWVTPSVEACARCARAEGVVHVDVRQLAERGRELIVVLGLARLEADVLEQQHPARLQAIDGCVGARSDDVVGEVDVRTGQLGQTRRDRRQREGGVGRALGPSEVAREDHLRAAAAQVLDRRQRRADASVVGDRAVLDRDVEVDADEHAAPVDVDLVEALHCKRWTSSTTRLE